MQDGKPTPVKTDEFFAGRRVALFSVPGAFTPTCSAKHLPSFLENEKKLRDKGVDAIACVAVNDVFVMNAWGSHAGADGRVTMLADGNGEFARALGLELDATKFGMGMRGKRWSMLIDDGVVTQLNIEEPGAFGVSSGDHMVGQL
jgi:peroxiredoxin